MSLTISQGPNPGINSSSVDAVSLGLSSANAPALNPFDRNIALRDAAVKATRDAAAKGGTSNAYAVLRRAFPNYELAGISALTIPTADARGHQRETSDRSLARSGSSNREVVPPGSRLSNRSDGKRLESDNTEQGTQSREEVLSEQRRRDEENGRGNSLTQRKLSSENPSAVISLQRMQNSPLAAATVRALNDMLSGLKNGSESQVAWGINGKMIEGRAAHRDSSSQQVGRNLTDNGTVLDLRSVYPTPELVVAHREAAGEQEVLTFSHVPEGRSHLGENAATREVPELKMGRTAINLTPEDRVFRRAKDSSGSLPIIIR